MIFRIIATVDSVDTTALQMTTYIPFTHFCFESTIFAPIYYVATNTMSKKRKWHLVPQCVSLEATATLSVSGLITNDHHHHHHHQQQVPTSSSIV